ncbi:hypothetical protein Hte_003097 [Hypoxylon texense]
MWPFVGNTGERCGQGYGASSSGHRATDNQRQSGAEAAKKGKVVDSSTKKQQDKGERNKQDEANKKRG